MTNLQKDKYSMRAMAAKEMIKNFPKLSYPILKLPEPYDQELRRVNVANLQDRKAMKFAFSLECIETKNKPNGEFVATNYSPIYTTSNSYFTRFLHQEDTSSLGLILTDVDRKRLKFYQNGDPVLWQMGPERRHLALVQRAEYFKTSQSKEVHKLLDDLEKSKDAFPSRTNHRSAAVEELLGIEASKITTKAASLQELGYKKLDSNKYTSRTSSAKSGLFNIVGKHPRSIYGVGSLPAVSGWRDVIVTSAIGHILTFVHRNSMNAVDAENQIKLIQSAQKVIKNLKLNDKVTIGHLII
jgi:hypothetical protein